METLKILGIVFVVIIIGFAILSWSARRDEQVAIQAQAYEECVKKEFGTTPSAWYNEHGQYPVCNY